MKSKENKMISLFFNSPTREWHFEEILQEVKIARSKAANWLKKLKKDGIIRKVKEKGKMPYYTSNYDSPSYKNKKKIFALNRLYESGLLNHLTGLKKAKTIIVFGSFSRWDWHKDSDIDIFIYGNPEGLRTAKYEQSLHHDIQLFICQNKKELKRLGQGLMKNIIQGSIIKGNLDFVKVS